MEELWRKSTNTAFKTAIVWSHSNTVTMNSPKKASQTSQASQTMYFDVHSICGCMWRLPWYLPCWCCFSVPLVSAALAAASIQFAGRSKSTHSAAKGTKKFRTSEKNTSMASKSSTLAKASKTFISSVLYRCLNLFKSYSY